jgi:hypothetical protein
MSEEHSEKTNPDHIEEGESPENLEKTNVFSDDSLEKTNVIRDGVAVKDEFDKTKLHDDVSLNDPIENTQKTSIDQIEPEKKKNFLAKFLSKFKKDSNSDNVEQSSDKKNPLKTVLGFIFWFLSGIFFYSISFYSTYLVSLDHVSFGIIIGSFLLGTFLIGILLLIKKFNAFIFFALSQISFLSVWTFYLLLHGTYINHWFFFLDYLKPYPFINFLLIFFLFHFLSVLFYFPKKIIFKLILILPLLFGFFGLGYYIYFGLDIFQGWKDFDNYIPGNLFFLHPLWFLIQVYLVLSILFYLVGIFLSKDIDLKKINFFQFLKLFTALIFCSFLLQEIRAPNLVSMIFEKNPFIGSMELSEQGRFVSLKSIYSSNKELQDYTPRINIEVVDLSLDTKTGAEYLISASTLQNNPAYFLSKDDFELFINDQKVDDWSFEPVLESDSSFLDLDTKENAFYKIKVSSSSPYPEFDIHKRGKSIFYSPNESVHFSLNEASPPVKFVEVFLDNRSVLKLEPEAYKRFFEYSLRGVNPGSHKLQINMTAVNNQKSSIEKMIEIIPLKKTKLLNPVDNQLFKDSLEVMIDLPDYYPIYQTKIEIRLSGDLKKVIESPPYHTLINTSNVNQGIHSLDILVKTIDEEKDNRWVENEKISLSIIKNNKIPEINFLSPTIGEFLNLSTKFSISVGNESYNYVELYRGSERIHSWDYPPYILQLDTDNFKEQDQIFFARAYNDTGLALSTFNEVNLGQGRLQVSLDQNPDLSNANFAKKIIFILDASLSMNDQWDDRSKWFWSNVIFSIPELTQSLEKMQVGIMALGLNTPSSFKNCQDKDWISEDFSFVPNEILAKTNQIKPKGLFSLYYGIEHTMQLNPDKIVVISDGLDACENQMPKTLSAKLAQRKTSLEIILLGDLPQKYQNQLLDLKRKTFSSVRVVESGQELKDTIVDLLAINYELYLGNKKVFKAPLNNQEHLLRSGTYEIKLPLYPELNLPNVEVYNGLTSRYQLMEERKRLVLKPAL